MASDAQNTLYDIFAGLFRYGGGGLAGGLTGPGAQAASSSAAGAAQASKSGGSTAGTIVKDVLKSGFGLISLVTTFAGLFGGGDGNTPAPLVKYALPAAQEFEAAETATGFAGLDYDQAGATRVYDPRPRPASQPHAYSANPSRASAPQVNVTVQAMDARSFLDRSTDIAAAVREAMLNLNSINDVVNDL
jgi:hypothetical protein